MIKVEKVKEYIDAGHDHYEVANWLINIEVSKHIPLSLDDLPDTATKASEVDAIVECLEEGDYQDAINIAYEAAYVILEEEGFELNNNE